MADAVGLVVLAVEAALLAVLRPLGEGVLANFAIIFLIAAAATMLLWRSEESPKTAMGWVLLAAGSFLIGLVFFGIDVLLGHLQRPSMPWLEAGTQVGGPAGFGLTLIACPGMTVIVVAGAARALVLRSRDDDKEEEP